MATIESHNSADGLLRFLIVRDDDGDVALGFDGFPWHTHGDLLVGAYGASQEIAIQRFVDDLLNNRSLIAILRQGGVITDTWITDDPQADLRTKLEIESIEFRHWDGSPRTANSPDP